MRSISALAVTVAALALPGRANLAGCGGVCQSDADCDVRAGGCGVCMARGDGQVRICTQIVDMQTGGDWRTVTATHPADMRPYPGALAAVVKPGNDTVGAVLLAAAKTVPAEGQCHSAAVVDLLPLPPQRFWAPRDGQALLLWPDASGHRISLEPVLYPPPCEADVTFFHAETQYPYGVPAAGVAQQLHAATPLAAWTLQGPTDVEVAVTCDAPQLLHVVVADASPAPAYLFYIIDTLPVTTRRAGGGARRVTVVRPPQADAVCTVTVTPVL